MQAIDFFRSTLVAYVQFLLEKVPAAVLTCARAASWPRTANSTWCLTRLWRQPPGWWRREAEKTEGEKEK
jgi:hypothetical protein